LALGDGERIWYYDRNIAWYEDGSGISTNGSTKWGKILYQEYKSVIYKVRERHPKDPLIQIAAMNYAEMSKWEIRIKRIIKYPLIMIAKILLLPKRKQKVLLVTQTDMYRLQRLLSGEIV